MHFITASIQVEFDSRSEKKLSTALIGVTANEVKKQLNKNKAGITTYVREIVHKNLMNSPEAASLSGEDGKLRIELGVKDGAADIAKIIDEIVSKTNIAIVTVGMPSKEININIEIYIDGEYVNLYSQQYSSYISSGGTKIEWLSWLLEAGNSEVVFGYKIKYGVEVGRTGDAIMMPSRSSNWSVPPEFSGVTSNNFITRSFEGIEKDLLQYIGGILI